MVSLVGTESSGFVEWVELLSLLGDLDSLDGIRRSSAWKNLTRCLGSGSCRLELVSSRVVNLSLLGLALNTGPQNELILVSVQSLNIELKGVVVTIGSAVITSDSDGSGEAWAESGGFQLEESETTAISNFACIPTGLGSDNGSQLLERSWEELSSLVLSASVPTKLGSWLIVMSVVLLPRPVLAEMYVWDDVVVLDHC